MLRLPRRSRARAPRALASLLLSMAAAACAHPTTSTPAEPVTPALPPPLDELAPAPGGEAGAAATSASSPSPAQDSAATEAASQDSPAQPSTRPPPEAESSGPTPTRSAVDLITQRDVAFLVDYANSEARAKSEEKCERESAGDPEKRGACLTKAREQFTADVLRFVRDASGRTTFKIYKRNGSNLSEIYVGAVNLAEESNTAVRVEFKSAGKGTRPLFRAQKDGLVTVPNDYSLELADPELGALTYSAKVGLVGD